MFEPDAGSVRLQGREIQALAPHRICAQGLARSFQITNLFKGLTIYENLRLSLQAKHPARFNAWRDIDSYAEIHAQTDELVRFLGLEGRITSYNVCYTKLLRSSSSTTQNGCTRTLVVSAPSGRARSPMRRAGA